MTIRNVVGALALGLASIMPIEARALDGYIRYVRPVEGSSTSYVEPNTFYTLPGNVKGYTWADLKQDGGYYGESNFEREIITGLNAKVQVNHPDELVGRTGVGMSADIPFLPKRMRAKVTAFPVFFDDKGSRIDRSEVNYGASVGLPYGIRLSSFGEIISIGKGPEWSYGELSLGRKIGEGPISVNYNPTLRNAGKGKLRPKLEHRIDVGVEF